jgi:hypothetical protein
MSGFNRTQADDLIAAVNAVNAVNKVSKKGRKRASVNDVAWKEALSENMEREGLEPIATKREETSTVEAPAITRQDDFPGDKTYRDKMALDANTIDDMMKEIRRLSDEPEKLLESHLSVFTEPAPPGKTLDSSG